MDLISAICVSHSSRWGLLQRAILNYIDQEYRPLELIVAVTEPGYYDQIRSFIVDRRIIGLATDVSDLLNIRPLHIRPLLVRGRESVEIFMHALAAARGEWIACWDDDNLSHPKRFIWQKERTCRSQPSVLAQSLYYFYDSDELFVTVYAQPSGRPADRCAAGSLLFHREAYPVLEFYMRDVWSAHFLDCAGKRLAYDCLAGDPVLFLAGSNGDNYRGEEFHRRMGSGLPATWTREAILRQLPFLEKSLGAYYFPHSEIDLCGKDAQACKITGVKTWPDWLASPLPPEDWRCRLPSREQQNLLSEERRQARERKGT